MIQIKLKSNFGVKPFNLNWWEPTKTEWAPVLLESNKPFWKIQTEPSGRPWKKLSKGYQAWKDQNYPGQTILRLTGKMQDTAKIRTSLRNDRFEVLSTEVGPYHQFGTSRMPSRPWMGVPDTSLQKLTEIAWKNILKKS